MQAKSDALIGRGLLVMALSVSGIIRMPDIYTRLRAASKSVFLGVIATPRDHLDSLAVSHVSN